MKTLTPRQTEVLEYIMSFIENNGYPPTYREIGACFKITPYGVSEHLRYIAKKRYITVDGSRAIVVLASPKGNPVKWRFETIKKENYE